MPRVVPSQVVSAIDRMFGANRPQLKDKAIGYAHRNQVRTLLSLLDRVPQELMTIPFSKYSEYLEACSALISVQSRWDVGDTAQHADTLNRGDPVEIIRRVLNDCPDEVPTPHPELLWIDDAAARAGIQEDIRAAWIDFRAGEWKGATVFAATAVESLLFWTLKSHPGHPNPERLDDQTLRDYINEAEKLSVIKKKAADQARLAIDGRNLIHPGKTVKTQSACTKTTALISLAALEAVVADLLKLGPG